MIPCGQQRRGVLLNRVIAAASIAGLGLSGCVSRSAEAPAARSIAPVEASAPYTSTGLESVLGRTARIATGLFGAPALDVREGPARKLQFLGPACVLDLYLYPPRAGGDPIVTHIDARLPDGRDMDRASCVAALSRR
jgi:hypothetical protein